MRVATTVIDDLRVLVEAAGPLGPAAFVGVYVALTVALVPASLLTVAAGVVFGVVWGSVLVVAGATLGAVAAFEVARRLGRDRTRRLVGGRALRADAWLTRRGIAGVVGLRLLPVVPFNVLNYAFGLSSVPRRDHAVGTIVGIIPGSVAITAFGSSFTSPGSAGFLVSLGAVIVLFGASPARSWYRGRQARGAR